MSREIARGLAGARLFALFHGREDDIYSGVTKRSEGIATMVSPRGRFSPRWTNQRFFSTRFFGDDVAEYDDA